MAKYDAAKFYWLQLKEDFFDEDAIDWLEEQPNGKEYSLFYLKLCLKSLRTNGILIRRVGEMLIPYDNKKLGELTKTNPDTCLVAMNLLIKIGLVKQLDSGELYLTQVEHMIGSQSKGAFKKQQQRIAANSIPQLPSGQEGDNCPPKIEIEIDIEKDIEEDKDKDKELKKEDKKVSKKASGYDEIVSSNFSNQQVINTIYEFIKMRKLMKKPLTDFALTKLCNKLKKFTDDEQKQIHILEQSILKNWQDIYELKEDKYKQESKPSEFNKVAENIRKLNEDDSDQDEDYYKNLNF